MTTFSKLCNDLHQYTRLQTDLVIRFSKEVFMPTQIRIDLCSDTVTTGVKTLAYEATASPTSRANGRNAAFHV